MYFHIQRRNKTLQHLDKANLTDLYLACVPVNIDNLPGCR